MPSRWKIVRAGEETVGSDEERIGALARKGRKDRIDLTDRTGELGHWGTNVVDGAAMSLPFDLLTDFEPIALIASNPLLITSRKDLPAANLQELVAYIKARPSKVTLAEPGATAGFALAHFVIH